MPEAITGALEGAAPPQSEELQKQVEEYIAKGYTILYDEGEALVATASRNPETKVEDVATAGFLMGQRIDQSVQGRGPYPDEVKIAGGAHLVEKIIEFAEQKGTPPFTQEEKGAALESTLQKYMHDGIKNRTIDPIQLANEAEQVQPGSIRNAMAKLPDNISNDRVTPGAAPAQGQVAPGKGQASQGLLTQPSPLEGFLNGRLG